MPRARSRSRARCSPPRPTRSSRSPRRLGEPFVAAVALILRCRGRVVVTGIGKSGHIARKLAATLASTGTPAFFVHPAEASHGDLGMIAPGDVVVMLSNSGETDELVLLAPHFKRQGAKLIALTGNEQLLARAGGRRPPRRRGRRRSLPARPRAHREHHGGAGAGRRAGAGAARRARLLDRGFRALASRRRARPAAADARARRHAQRQRAADRRPRRDARARRSSK